MPLPKQNIINSYLNNYKKIKVTSDSLIKINGKSYSVDPQYINCFVEIQQEDNKLNIYYKNSLIDTFNLDIYNKKINYKEEHYCKALAQSYGKNVKPEDVESQALENLKNLDRLGGIVNEI